MKRTLFAAISSISLALASVPVTAQTVESEEPTADEFAAIGNLFGDMFGSAEPLTEEQEARIPAAKSVVTKLFPEGTYAKMMDETMKPMLDGIMTEMAGTPTIALSQLTGLSPLDLAELEDDKLKAALELLDPQAEERNRAMADVTVNLVTELVEEIEPAYRAGLARAYAVRFTQEELADLDAYFATPVGSKYAAESFLIFADPQVMSSMNEMMPKMMERMPGMIGSMTEIAAQYPEGRKFSALDESEQSRLAELLGVTLEDLAINEPASAEDGEEF